jgi:hypothetical protein
LHNPDAAAHSGKRDVLVEIVYVVEHKHRCIAPLLSHSKRLGDIGI